MGFSQGYTKDKSGIFGMENLWASRIYCNTSVYCIFDMYDTYAVCMSLSHTSALKVMKFVDHCNFIFFSAKKYYRINEQDKEKAFALEK